MKWYKRLYYYLMYGNLPKHGAAPRSRIVNDPITWGDLCDKQPTWKVDPPKPWPDPPPPSFKRIRDEDIELSIWRYKNVESLYFRVDCLDLDGNNIKSFYQSTEYELMLDTWSTLDNYYRVTVEYMIPEEFDNLPDYKG